CRSIHRTVSSLSSPSAYRGSRSSKMTRAGSLFAGIGIGRSCWLSDIILSESDFLPSIRFVPHFFVQLKFDAMKDHPGVIFADAEQFADFPERQFAEDAEQHHFPFPVFQPADRVQELLLQFVADSPLLGPRFFRWPAVP